MNGWIKLYRQLQEWEWYKDANTSRLFLHLLINANHSPTRWQGVDLRAGELVVGRKKLASELGLSERNIRTSLKRLKSTNDIATKTTNKFTIVTVCKWDIYQNEKEAERPTKRPTSQPANDQQTTTDEEYKKEKKLKDISNDISIDYAKLTEFFHNVCPDLPKVQKLTPSRKKAIEGIGRNYGKSEMRHVMEEVGKSDFLCGRSGNFKASFDWIFKPANFVKILEGNYANKPKKTKDIGKTQINSPVKEYPGWD